MAVNGEILRDLWIVALKWWSYFTVGKKGSRTDVTVL